MRSSLIETRGEDYLELIEAKGASEARVLFHAARGSLLPVMTWVVHMFGYAMASTVVIEMVFAWPGFGREIITAVGSFDYPMAQAAFFLISLIIITLNLLLDLCLRGARPARGDRVRAQHTERASGAELLYRSARAIRILLVRRLRALWPVRALRVRVQLQPSARGSQRTTRGPTTRFPTGRSRA